MILNNKIFTRLFFYYLKNLIFLNIGLLLIIYLADMAETFRKYQTYDISLFSLAYISLMRIPYIFIDLSPFVVLFSSLFAFKSLVGAKEIEILKASGLSIWSISKPFLLVTFLYAIFVVAILNPLNVISRVALFDAEQKIFNRKNINHYMDNNMFWLLDNTNNNQKYIIYGSNFSQNDQNIDLSDVVIIHIINNQIQEFIIAQKGNITKNIVILSKVIINNTKLNDLQQVDSFSIQLKNKSSQISNTNTLPEDIYVYSYPKFIFNLKKIGLDATVYEIYFYNLITLPLLFFTMLLLSIGFSLSDSRTSKAIYLVTLAIIAGFLAYFSVTFLSSLGAVNGVPVYISVILTRIIVLLIAVYLLVKKEGT